ncbi:hypothetical protein [Natrinema sp. SYSU A 869]|uniref:hypothetical protein n=1 Tax=Natrinema sp. SYSU A 869 TaxID=2871694 RepID=UPI001CA4093F|nr:hypothetical protein [Natrinema sp. SYSU A 869]
MSALHTSRRGPLRAGVAATGTAATGCADGSTAPDGTDDVSPSCEPGSETDGDGHAEGNE